MDKKCSKCDSKTTLIYNERSYWYYDEDEKLICRKCYLKYIANPKRNMRCLKFGERTIVFTFIIRKGICSIKNCSATNTQRHHIEYISCFPLAMTVELCLSHHMEENNKQETLQQEYYFDWNRTMINVVAS